MAHVMRATCYCGGTIDGADIVALRQFHKVHQGCLVDQNAAVTRYRKQRDALLGYRGKRLTLAACEWRRGDRHGMSSLTIFAVAHGGKHSGCYPHDSSDFGRCSDLLKVIPWFDIREMATINAAWAALVNRWAEFEALYAKGLMSPLWCDMRAMELNKL